MIIVFLPHKLLHYTKVNLLNYCSASLFLTWLFLARFVFFCKLCRIEPTTATVRFWCHQSVAYSLCARRDVSLPIRRHLVRFVWHTNCMLPRLPDWLLSLTRQTRSKLPIVVINLAGLWVLEVTKQDGPNLQRHCRAQISTRSAGGVSQPSLGL